LPADSRILQGFNLEDLDRASLAQYRQRFASHKPTHPWLSEDDIGLLRKLGGWRRDRNSGQEGLTVAGLLMFGTDEALREALPNYHVDYRELLSADPLQRWSDRIHIDGAWHPNLFQFYLRVVLRLGQDLKLPFQLDNDLFRRGETIVHEALREALVNALIHADYLGVGGVLIEKHQDRFIFSNPGTLLVSLEQLMQGNVSECRNKSLQTMFLMMGAAEKAGSGVDKIRSGWESQHWRQPLVQEQTQPDRVRWVLPMVSLIPEESFARLQARFGYAFETCSKLEVQALVTADVESVVDNLRLRQMTGSHARDVTDILQSLVARGLLRQEGRGRWTRYRLPENHGDAASSQELRSVPSNRRSVHSDRRSVPMQPDSVPREALDDEEKTELEQLAALARNNRRLPPQEMEGLILQLCSGRWLSRRELADLLHRNADSLRTRFLTRMVGRGLLRLRYPDTPNRSDQAYTAVSVTENSAGT
jgi:ATP-dependent DNA helicase RecG